METAREAKHCFINKIMTIESVLNSYNVYEIIVFNNVYLRSCHPITLLCRFII
jgi:hypothetical protein